MGDANHLPGIYPARHLMHPYPEIVKEKDRIVFLAALLLASVVSPKERDAASSAFIRCAFAEAIRLDDQRSKAGDVADAAMLMCRKQEGAAWQTAFDFNVANHFDFPDQKAKATIKRIKEDVRIDLIAQILNNRASTADIRYPSGSKPSR